MIEMGPQKKKQKSREVQFDDSGIWMEEQAEIEEVTEQTEHLRGGEAPTGKRKRKNNFELSSTGILEEISGSRSFLSVCRKCDFTCHGPCRVPNGNKNQCWAMGPSGHCTKCPGKCYWTEHVNKNYKWESEEIEEKWVIVH